jgi:hypothetical protein
MATFQNGTTYEQTLVVPVDGRTIDVLRTHSWVDGALVLTNPAHNHAVRLMRTAMRDLQATLTRTADGSADHSSYRFQLPDGMDIEHNAPALFLHLGLSSFSTGADRVEYHREKSRDAALLRALKKAER